MNISKKIKNKTTFYLPIAKLNKSEVKNRSKSNPIDVIITALCSNIKKSVTSKFIIAK